MQADLAVSLTVDVNVNFPGVLPILQKALEIIMSIADDTAAIKAAAEAAAARETELVGKVDSLILVANTTKDALVALQQAGTAIDPAALTSIINTLNGVATSAADESTKVDAASTAVAP